MGQGVELGGRMCYYLKANQMGIICLLKPIRYRASFRSKTSCKCLGWGGDPQMGGRGGARGSKMVPFESVMSVSYKLSIVTKALSLTVFAEPSNVTDRRTELV